MRRPVIVTIIALFWAAMIGGLVYYEWVLPRLATVSTETGISTIPRDYWMGVYIGETERAGFVNVRTRPEEREEQPGSQIKLTARARLNLFGYDAEMAVTGHAWLAEDRKRAIFDYTLVAGESKSRISGSLKDGTLKAILDAAGVETPFTFPVSDELILGSGLGAPSMDLPILKPGESVYIDSFDPSTMSTGRAKLECLRRETIHVAGEDHETSVINITLGGMTSQAWVTDEQETVQALTPVGIMLRKITPEEAMEPFGASERVSLVEDLMVRPTGAPVSRGVSEVNLRITGLPNDVTIPSDAVQRNLGNGEWKIEVPEDPRRMPPAPLSMEERAASLQSDPLVNAENESIKAIANEAIAGTVSDWDKALALYEWVYANIRKVPTLSIPTAVDVLRTRQGDCNEHTVLYCAMARSVGLPSRIAVGLVYSEVLGGFGYHAWPEVHVGGWVPLDPTLGQPVADATHIKLVNGGIDKWASLVGYMGKLEIEIVSASGTTLTESEYVEIDDILQ